MKADTVTTSSDYCTYIVVSASTIDELQKKVNEIVEQGWQTEGIPSGGWHLSGGVTWDGKNYLQVMMNCPVASAARPAAQQ